MTVKGILADANGTGKIVAGSIVTMVLVALIMFTFGSWREQNAALASNVRDNRAFTQEVNDRTLVVDTLQTAEINFMRESLVRIELKIDENNRLIKDQ